MNRIQAVCAFSIVLASIAVPGIAYSDSQPGQSTPQPARASAFLKVDGVPGVSSARGHQGWIEVSSLSWGHAQASHGTGSGGGTGKTKITEIHITKTTDTASPKLAQLFSSGAHVRTVVLQFVSPSNGKVYQATLNDVVVTGRQGSGGGESPKESVTFTFGQIQIAFAQQNSDGTTGDFHPNNDVNWDLEQNIRL